jgi:hypothetical protein
MPPAEAATAYLAFKRPADLQSRSREVREAGAVDFWAKRMKREEAGAKRTPGAKRVKSFVYRATVVMMLLVAVPALAIRVKSSLYVPNSGFARLLSIANKVKVTHPPTVANRREPLQGSIRRVPVEYDDHQIPLQTGSDAVVQEVHQSLCRFQHRSPPFPLV